MDELVSCVLSIKYPLKNHLGQAYIVRKIPDKILREVATDWFLKRGIKLVDLSHENFYPTMEKMIAFEITLEAKKYFAMSLGNGIKELEDEFKQFMIDMNDKFKTYNG